MAYAGVSLFELEIAKGNVAGHTFVNKFGRATDCDSGVDTDIWSRANATDEQKVWLAPTQARVHSIVGGANDTIGGTGCNTLKIFGLTDWNSDEVSEDVEMAGAGGVNTVNSYVIIHRMRALTWGSAGPNDAQIKATAAVDGTVTAQFEADKGQTEMAIYGVPSTKVAFVKDYYCSGIKAASSLAVAISLLVNPIPEDQLGGFIVKHTNGIATEGTNYMTHHFDPYFKVTGPAIIKIQGNSSANNTDVSAGFDITLVDRDILKYQRL